MENLDRASHGMGGPGHNVKAEFNSKPHKRGTLSMARANDPDSAGSQFFICVNDANFLDWQYTVFGEVQSGLDVVDKVVGSKRDGRDNPLERVEMSSPFHTRHRKVFPVLNGYCGNTAVADSEELLLWMKALTTQTSLLSMQMVCCRSACLSLPVKKM